MPINRITLDVEPESGMRWDASVDKPIAEPTAERASNTGTPAAMIAPNAISRITNVTGRL